MTESIAINLPCISCGYNLRTLQRESRCPECGTPIEQSVQGSIVVRGPAYVRTVWTSALELCVLNMVGIIAAVLLVSTFKYPLLNYHNREGLTPIPFIVFAVISVAYAVIAWRLTLAAPPARSPDKAKFIQITSILFAGAMCLASWMIGRGFAPRGIDERMTLFLLFFLPLVFLVSQQFGKLFRDYCHAAGFKVEGNLCWIFGNVLAVSLVTGGVAFPILITSAGEYACFVQLPCLPGFLMSIAAFVTVTVLLGRVAARMKRLTDKAFELSGEK